MTQSRQRVCHGDFVLTRLNEIRLRVLGEPQHFSPRAAILLVMIETPFFLGKRKKRKKKNKRKKERREGREEKIVIYFCGRLAPVCKSNWTTLFCDLLKTSSDKFFSFVRFSSREVFSRKTFGKLSFFLNDEDRADNEVA